MLKHTWRQLAIVWILVLSVVPASAQSLEKLDTALNRVPADAAFFSTMLRNKEQIDLALQSKAWKKLWNLPFVQMAWNQMQQEMKKDQSFQKFLDDKENQELLALLGDSASHEIFFCGGAGWIDSIKFFQEIYGTTYWNNFNNKLGGGGDDPRAQVESLVKELLRHQDRIKIPDLMIGFKLSDTKRAENQLARLEALIKPQIEAEPKMKGRLKSETINGGRFLVLNLDGSMIPWDEIPLDQFEDQREQLEKLFKKLSTTTLTLCIGVQQGYLMLALGADTKHLANFGGSGPRLHSVAEMQPLAKYADRKLVSIDYVSKKLIELANQNVDLKQLVEQLKKELPETPLSDEQKERLLKDASQLASEWKYQPVAGAMMSFYFLSNRGVEGFAYDYAVKPEIDASKPLSLLHHVGDKPIFAAVGRGKVDGTGYAFFSKWVKTAWSHIDEFTQSQLDEDAKQKYDLVTGIALPALKRIDEITSQSLIPALADGQSAFVVDAKWKNKQWILHLPPTPQALPMLELAIVLGVSDDAKLASAMGGYRKVYNDTIAAIGKQEGYEAVTLARMPPPETNETDNGMLYYYPLPGLLGLDERVAPTAGLSKKVAALTLSNDHAQRLLKSSKLSIESAPLANLDRPLAKAVLFDFPELVQSLSPWIDLAANSIINEELGRGGKEVPAEARDAILSQVRTVLEVLQVFRASSSATYLEKGAMVTHSETVIRDVE